MNRNFEEIFKAAELTIKSHGNNPLYSLSLNEMESVFKSWALQIVECLSPEQPEQKYYTRKEVCKIFDISYPTIIEYEKRGLITGSRIGHKVYYSQEDINQALRRLPKERNSRI